MYLMVRCVGLAHDRQSEPQLTDFLQGYELILTRSMRRIRGKEAADQGLLTSTCHIRLDAKYRR
jgi:hypothetical protein